MNIHSNPSREPQSVKTPVCDLGVSTGFLGALKVASKFAGKPHKVFPWVQYVYLVEGKLYASDNRCVIEIGVGDPSFGPARFSPGDVSVFRAMGSSPQRARFDASEAAFAWSEGQWCIFRGELKGLELVEQSRSLLDKFYRKGPKLEDSKGVMWDIARKKKGGEIQQFKASATGLPQDYHWHCDSILKVLAIAERLNTKSVPNSFTFPNGRGLIVQPSQHSIAQ